MTDAKFKSILESLRARQRALNTEVHHELADSGERRTQELAGAVGDTGDESVAAMMTDLDLATVNRHVTELRDIEAALARLEDGSYGVCTDCGRDINVRRLEAYPTAQRCVECQGLYEKTHAHRETPTL